MIKVEEISQLIKTRIKGFEKEIDVQEVGTVISVGDGIARIYGLEKAMAGELLEFPGGRHIRKRPDDKRGLPGKEDRQDSRSACRQGAHGQGH